MLARIAFALLLLPAAVAAHAQQFGPAQFPIRADDGALLSNHSLTAEQMARLSKLPGNVSVGNPKGDVTVYQFYDLNCPFCREAAQDVDSLLRADRALQLVFVPYPTLSVQSIEGARVELALRELASPQQFLEFHRKVYAGRGVIDGQRALAAAQAIGFERNKLITAANAPHITETMKAHALFGTALKIVATPSYVIQGVAILGHPGLEPLRKLVASARACKKVIC